MLDQSLLNKIHLGDCLDFMRQMPDKCVDLVLTDPPYGEQTHSGAVKDSRGGLQVDFQSVDLDFILNLVSEFVRLTKTWIIFTCEWRFVSEIEKEFPDEFIRMGIWTKPVYTPQMSGDRPAMGWEAIVMMHPKGKKTWNGGGKSSVYNFGRDNEKAIHTTQKPIQLWKQLLKDFKPQSGTVLDCFSGSGTTALACHDLNLDFICIEKDPDYHAASVKRLEEHKRQGRLF